MPLYEHVYLARQDASTQQVEELTAQLKGVIEGLGGSIAKNEYWGVKSLSYRLRKNRKAHFTLMNVNAPPAAINEIERLERLNEDVLRYLTIRVEEHEEGPSAMMRRAEREWETRPTAEWLKLLHDACLSRTLTSSVNTPASNRMSIRIWSGHRMNSGLAVRGLHKTVKPSA